MNAVDGSDHYNKTSDDPPPSLLTIILDTNPPAWALLTPTLPLSAALANLLVFINAHLASNNSNKVAIIASHSQRAEFLYPVPSNHSTNTDDTQMTDPDPDQDQEAASAPPSDSANHYLPFRHIQTTLLSSLRTLYATTTPSTLTTTPTTSIAGALTLALTYINKQSLALSPAPLNPRILILSVSGDLAHQYIPIMNTIFACQRLQIPIDILKLSGDSVFLQQASDATRGTYVAPAHPRGLLQYLMLGFLPDQSSRRYLVPPTAVGVDFRAACFCHRKVVDVGFVCSICLSIFCSPPEGAICLTCGTHLQLGEYGGKPAVVVKRKKKRKKGTDEEMREPA